RADDRVGLVAVRRMAAAGELHELHALHGAGDAVHLRHRPVLVVHALDRHDRRLDRGDLGLDAPGAEGRCEPDVVPAPEGGIHVVVIAREALAQVGLEVRDARALDALDRELLHEDVRRRDDHPRHARGEARREKERDGSAVAMAIEGYLAGEPDRIEECGQHLVRLPVHEVRLPALLGLARRGLPVARPRIDEPAHAEGRGEARGEVAPHRARAQPFVQENHRGGALAHPLVLDADGLAVPGDVGESRAGRLAHALAVASLPARAASRSRRRKRWIFPVAVLGSSSMNSMMRGYLWGASAPFTNAFSSASSAGVAVVPGLRTTNALERVRPFSSAVPITAASRTA